ncbi:MAG: NAD-dependent epimerase/dehydratase family protein [Pseudomonadota bacterium]
MRVLVTGGTGFLGAHVVRAHLARGWRVRCAVRPTSPSLTLEGLDVERVEVDLSDPDAVAHALEGCEAVQHLAGAFDVGPGGRARMDAMHVQATRLLCEAALARPTPPRLVLCSSSSTVAWGPRARPADEQAPLGDLDAVYGRGDSAYRAYIESKLAGEAVVREYARRGLHAVIVNPDYVLGAWDLKPTSGALLVAMAKHPVPVYPRGGKCFVDAADCGLGHVLALEKGMPGERYLLGVHNLSYRELMTAIARQVGRRPPRIPLPRTFTSALSAGAGAVQRLFPGRQAGLDPSVLLSMQAERYRDGGRARRELGLPSTPIEHSIAEALRWFRAHGYC